MSTPRRSNRRRPGLPPTIRSLLETKEKLATLERRFLVDLMHHLPAAGAADKVVVAKRSGNGAPASRRLKCPKCRRQFRLPMHLGRHIASTHPTRRRRAA